MNPFRQKITKLLFILIILIFNNLYAQGSEQNEIWKTELQIILGFTGEEVDGIMGIETFNALKRFAYHHDLADVVLRGEFDDIEFWGFEQYLIKYHKYWIREIKNQRIFQDVHDKEYLKQADETLYTFEIAIQNAKLEVERLAHAKSNALRLAQEKQELEDWEFEKREAERLTAELQQSILAAELEVDKWSLERIRAQRLAAEKEQLERLSARKAEATRLTSELDEIIVSAKSEIDRLIDENRKMKKLIENSEKTETMAAELITKLSSTNEDLAVAQGQIQVLSFRNDTLEIKLQDAKIEIENMMKLALTNIDSQKQKKWYQNFALHMYHNLGLNINNNNLINSGISLEPIPTIALDVRYHLPWKPKVLNREINWNILIEYAPMFEYNNQKTQLYGGYIQNQIPIKWNFGLSMKLGATYFTDAVLENNQYISFSTELGYKLPLKYKFISTSIFITPQIMQSVSGITQERLLFWNTGLRIAIN